MRLLHHIYEHPQRLLITAFALLILSWGVAFYAIFEQRHATRENAARIAENEKTAHALCMAAAGARDFWKGRRDSTALVLSDPSLSAIQRSANENFVLELTQVIIAADGVAHGCDQKEGP